VMPMRIWSLLWENLSTQGIHFLLSAF
jgi:hypothetical protein